MFKQVFLVLVLLISFNSFSQKCEIVQRSSFKHDYAIGFTYYVEDNIDTSKLFFVGLVKTTSSSRNEFVNPAITCLNSKTKELKGNAYKLKSYSLIDTTLVLVFDVYFASEKHISLMKAGGIKEKIILLNNDRDSVERTLVVNNKSYIIPNHKHFELSSFTKHVTLKLQNDSIYRGTSYNSQKNKRAVFLTIKKKDVVAAVKTGAAIGGVVGALVAREIAEGYPRNNDKNEIFEELNYNTGRILMNLYPVHQGTKIQ
jgi:hypothetical protein